MATTKQFTVDANTLCLWHMDGTVGSAGKKDNAETTAARDLTENGTPTASTGAIVPTSNGAYTLANTANLNLVCADFAAFPTGNMTVEFWINMANNAATDSEGIITKYNASGNRTFVIQRNTDDTLTFGVTSDGSTIVNVTSSAVSRNAWHFIACTYQTSTAIKIYIDGVLDSTNTTSIPASLFDSTANIYLGAYQVFEATAANTFDGSLDEVRISNKTRSAQEISDYYFDTTSNAVFFGAAF